MNRRKFLIGATAASLSARGYSQTEKLKDPGKVRYLFVTEGNGLKPLHIQPPSVPFKELGKRGKYSEHAIKDLPDALAPVADYKDKMLILQGISGRVCGGGHSNNHGTLGSFNARDGKLISGPTIDYLLGKRSNHIFDNIVLGINGNNRDIVYNISAAGNEKPIATICNPVLAYNRLFGAIGNKEQAAKDKLLFKYLHKDLGKLKERVGDNNFIEEYSSSFKSIEKRNERIKNTAGGDIPKLTEKYYSEDHVEMLDAHFEIAAAALKNDLSSSVTVAVGSGYEHFIINMNSLEGVSMPRHNLGHQAQNYKNEQAYKESNIVHNYIFKLIARTLKEVDNLVVVFCSDAAENHHSSCKEWPHVILGNHPNLKLDGRCIFYPEAGHSDHRTLNVLHNTLLTAGGYRYSEFGQILAKVPRAHQTGTLKEVLL